MCPRADARGTEHFFYAAAVRDITALEAGRPWLRNPRRTHWHSSSPLSRQAPDGVAVRCVGVGSRRFRSDIVRRGAPSPTAGWALILEAPSGRWWPSLDRDGVRWQLGRWSPSSAASQASRLPGVSPVETVRSSSVRPHTHFSTTDSSEQKKRTHEKRRGAISHHRRPG